MSNLKESLVELMQIEGAVGCSVVDFDSGMLLGSAGGGGLDLEFAAAGNSEVVKAKLRTMKGLGIAGNIEDILISLDNQYHIIRPCATHRGLFIYLVLAKSKSNLAFARRKVLMVEEDLKL